MQRKLFVSAIVLTLLVVIISGYAGPTSATTTTTTPTTTAATTTTTTSTRTETDIVTFPDENLEAVIRDALGKSKGEEITIAELSKLTKLVADHSTIADLSGLEYCTSLIRLDLTRNQISDISPLASLTNLTDLYLYGNQISDLSPLVSLTNLSALGLSDNQISDISPLLSLPNLRMLWIRQGNPLSKTSLKVHIPQLEKRGVSIPKPKTASGYLNIGHLLIPLFVLVAALVAVLRGYPTQHERRARRRRKWLVAGVIVAGLYTFCALVAVAAGGMQPIDLEDLLLFVVAPGLFLYGGVAVAWFLWSTRERKQQHKEEPE